MIEAAIAVVAIWFVARLIRNAATEGGEMGGCWWLIFLVGFLLLAGAAGGSAIGGDGWDRSLNNFNQRSEQRTRQFERNQADYWNRRARTP